MALHRESSIRSAPASSAASGYREPGDDFYCLRFEVWYASLDCAYRTLHRTCDGCLDCDQGRFNLRRHEGTLRLAQRARRAFD